MVSVSLLPTHILLKVNLLCSFGVFHDIGEFRLLLTLHNNQTTINFPQSLKAWN